MFGFSTYNAKDMINKVKKFAKRWWRGIKYDPSDPKYYEQVNIVAIGGGSGLSNLLEGLKYYTQNLTAIVTVTDSGTSSGRIRREFDILPPGDIRQCLAALSRRNGTLREIFEYRFKSNTDGDLNGHSFGNIWLAALTQYFGSFEKAIEESGNLLDIVGKVYPSTLDKVDLVCEFANGKKITGESEISEVNQPVKKLSLSKSAKAYEKAVLAIEKANIIVIGPGSLFTSIVPNILISGIREAIKNNGKALKVFVCNVSTERGETENLTAEDHIKILLDYLESKLDLVLVNDRIVKRSTNVHKLGEVNNITLPADKIFGMRVRHFDLIDSKNPLYHDNKKLAKAIMNCYDKKCQQETEREEK